MRAVPRRAEARGRRCAPSTFGRSNKSYHVTPRQQTRATLRYHVNHPIRGNNQLIHRTLTFNILSWNSKQLSQCARVLTTSAPTHSPSAHAAPIEIMTQRSYTRRYEVEVPPELSFEQTSITEVNNAGIIMEYMKLIAAAKDA